MQLGGGRMIEFVIEQRRRSLGAFEVGRVLPKARRRMIGPFIFFDHMGPVDLPRGLSRDVDVRPHPHIGLSTVRSEEHTSELQSRFGISYAVFCLKKKN